MPWTTLLNVNSISDKRVIVLINFEVRGVEVRLEALTKYFIQRIRQTLKNPYRNSWSGSKNIGEAVERQNTGNTASCHL